MITKNFTFLFISLTFLSFTLSKEGPFLVPKFERLKVGEIQPLGWLKNELELQAKGLAGHLSEFWPYIANSTWIGGNVNDPGDLDERVPYWLNGMVPLSFLVDNPEIKNQVNYYLDYIVEHQESDGWLGKLCCKPWPRYPLLLAMQQMSEGDPSKKEKYISVQMNFLKNLYSQLQKTPLSSWAQYRWQDLGLALIWLSKNIENQNDILFLEKFFDIIAIQGFNWEKFYHSEEFPRTACLGKCQTLATHGVNNGEALKSGAIRYFRDRNMTHLNETIFRLNILKQYHGQSTGMFSCSEHLAGLNPSQGYELCTIVETMFSLASIISAWGNVSHTDLLESIAFNALPAALDPYLWDHVYLEQTNNIHSGKISPNIYVSDGPDSNIYGLAPNYGCCTANFPQGFPKFVTHLFMKNSEDDGLVLLAYSPCEVSTTLGNNNFVKVQVKTNYPFEDNIELFIDSEKTFNLHLKIPTWINPDSKSWIHDSNGKKSLLQPGTFLKVEVGPQNNHIVIHFEMEFRFENGVNNASIIYRGPLQYSYAIPNYWTELKHYTFNSSDYSITPTAEWAIAINKTSNIQLIENFKNFKNENLIPTFSTFSCPLKAEIQGKPIPGLWKVKDGAADWPPVSPVKSTTWPAIISLLPHGCTQLRISQFPVLGN